MKVPSALRRSSRVEQGPEHRREANSENASLSRVSDIGYVDMEPWTVGDDVIGVETGGAFYDLHNMYDLLSFAVREGGVLLAFRAHDGGPAPDVEITFEEVTDFTVHRDDDASPRAEFGEFYYLLVDPENTGRPEFQVHFYNHRMDFMATRVRSRIREHSGGGGGPATAMSR